MNVAAVTYMSAGLYLGSKHIVGGRVPGELGLKFWKSRVGRWLFKLAGIGVDRLPSAGASYRPTEVAIGLAAGQLFEELPAEVRESFGELPVRLRALELHAESARARIAELDEMAHGIEQGAARDRQLGGAGQREGAANEIRQARAAAEQRLSDAVGALETIRLQLLRMHAGIGSAASMTEDLAAAVRLSKELEYMLEGGREVEQVLKLEKRQPTGNTPVPA
jgi:eukaryotic-like serine/threonine-protein kinase